MSLNNYIHMVGVLYSYIDAYSYNNEVTELTNSTDTKQTLLVVNSIFKHAHLLAATNHCFGGLQLYSTAQSPHFYSRPCFVVFRKGVDIFLAFWVDFL